MYTHVFGGFAAFWFLIAFMGSARAEDPQLDGVNLLLAQKVAFAPEEAGSDDVVQWKTDVSSTFAQYVRLHFIDIVDQTTSAYRVRLYDRSGKVTQEFDKAAFNANKEFWTNVIPGDFVHVEVAAAERPVGLSFNLLEGVVQRNSGAPFSLTIPDEREQIADYKTDLPELYRRSRAVAKLAFVKSGKPYVCTGFLIDRNRLLTNEHCVNTLDICRTTVAIFGYEALGSGGAVSSGEQFACDDLLKKSEKLDAALLRVRGEPGAIYGSLPLAQQGVALNQSVIMVQHPAGEPKQVSRKGCFVSSLSALGVSEKTDFGHKCDTLGGSSGSPILNEQFAVVGLHHFGFENVAPWRDQNRAVAIDLVRNEFGLR
jgi:V8-like Glu-specific endopeptidase